MPDDRITKSDAEAYLSQELGSFNARLDTLLDRLVTLEHHLGIQKRESLPNIPRTTKGLLR